MPAIAKKLGRIGLEFAAGCVGAMIGFYAVTFAFQAAGVDSCKMPAELPGFLLGMSFGCAMSVTIVSRVLFRKAGSGIAGVILAFVTIAGALVAAIMCQETIYWPWLAFLAFGAGSTLVYELLTVVGNMAVRKKARN